MKKTVVKVQRPKKLIKWQERLEAAKSGQDLSLMDKREFLYLGDRHVEKNINSVNQPKKQSNNIWNIGFEFIESQVNNQIPMPTVKSKREGFDTQAAMIADSISNDIKESDIEAINDRNERITPLQGFSIIEVAWNPNFKHHLYRGEIELIGRHPKQLVTQPKVYNLQKMDYFFILSDVTKDYVQRRYKKDLSGEEEQYPENTRLFDTDQNSSGSATSAQDTEEEPLTEIVCWYKDEDGDICKYVWINDTELEDLPKFFYRRNKDGTYMETEILDRDIVDVDGRPIAYKGEKVPMFIPSRYPVSVRINVPRNFHFGGQSDLDVIGDQQDSIKRVVHKMEEKIIKGGSLIKALEDHDRLKITDEIYQIIRGTQQQLAAIDTLDLTADISKDLLYCQEQYRIAQSMLGITNSFQGKEDVTATSGKAKQIQVQQASGRLNSKMFNKNVHFKELFEIIFEHKIAFYDEIRPYLAQDIEGNDSFGEFDKYLLLQRDKRGNLYWNTDFLIGTDGVYGLPKDPMFMYEQTMALFSAQAIDVQQLWTILEGLQFPAASRIKQQWSEKMNQQEQMAQMEQMITELQQQIEQMGGENQRLQGALEQTSQSNVQAEADAMQAANEGQRQQYEQQRQQEDSAHQKAMDIAKLQVEASKVSQTGRQKESA
ncbi:hypothetical protein MHI32_01595 [Paenibacillus sp. FSL H7-0690]|uniref:hypothetical protein n=1 Tax=Paenibacillus sp. FSL H7-0690 TaxID=2921437 RepID=UPI0030EB5D75